MSYLSNYTYFKYLYLPIVQTYYPLVQTYYSTNVLSIYTYSTNVLKYLYLVNPRSSTHVLTTIIGLAKLEYLYSYTFHPNHIIYRYNKSGRNSNQPAKHPGSNLGLNVQKESPSWVLDERTHNLSRQIIH